MSALLDACVCMSVCGHIELHTDESATANHDREGQAAHRRYRHITHSSCVQALQVRAMYNDTHINGARDLAHDSL